MVIKQITQDQAEYMIDVIFKNKKLFKSSTDILEAWNKHGLIETNISNMVTINATIEDTIFYALALEAHAQNITFNEYINMVLRNCINKYNDGR